MNAHHTGSGQPSALSTTRSTKRKLPDHQSKMSYPTIIRQQIPSFWDLMRNHKGWLFFLAAFSMVTLVALKFVWDNMSQYLWQKKIRRAELLYFIGRDLFVTLTFLSVMISMLYLSYADYQAFVILKKKVVIEYYGDRKNVLDVDRGSHRKVSNSLKQRRLNY